MTTYSVRGAITIEANTENAIKEATIELIEEILRRNSIETKNISHAIFTMTKDINKAYPAKFAREYLDFKFVPMMCFQEMDIENSLKQCLRIMLVVNGDKQQNEVKHVYLKGAESLRIDLK